MIKRLKKWIHALVLAVLILAPVVSYAAPYWWPIVPCGLNKPTPAEIQAGATVLSDSYYQPCNQCELIHLAKNLIDFTFEGIVPMVGTLLFIAAGFLILTGGSTGNTKQLTQGKDLFWNTVIGIAIMASAWLVANFILTSLAEDNKATEWYTIECRTGDLSNLVDATIPHPVSGGQPAPASGGGQPPLGPAQPPAPPGSGAQCRYSGVNLCEAHTMTCSASACGQYASAISRYASGAATANLLKAIMIKESSCNTNADSGHAYGLMQLTPDTAARFRDRCGGVNVDVNPQWLKSHPTESVCLAAEYIKSLAAGNCGSQTLNLAAGYNAGGGYCASSRDCANEKSCTDSGTMRKWECLYDDPQHRTCNVRLNETKDYAPKVLYCTNNPGF